MRKFFRFLLFGFIGLIGLCVFVLWYSGFFSPVYVMEKDNGPYKLVYTKVTQFEELRVKQNNLFNQLYNLDIIPDMTIGLYNQTEYGQVFDVTGCLIEEKDFNKFQPYETLFQTMDMDVERRIIAEFPYDNNFSIVAGSYRVYNSLKNYASEKGYEFTPPLEIYDSKNKRIYYVMQRKFKK